MDEVASDLRLLKLNLELSSKEYKELWSRASSEWKDLVNHLYSMRSSMQTLFEKLEKRENEALVKEKQLEAKETELNMKILEVESLQLLIEKKREELEVGLKQSDTIQDLIKEKERELDRVVKSILEGTEKLAVLKRIIQQKTEENQKMLKEFEDVIELKERQSNAKQRSFEKLSKEFELKEEQLKVCRTCISEFEKEIKLKEEKLKSFQNSIVYCSNELELKEKQLELVQKLKKENLDLLKKSVDECAHNFEMKERKFERLVKKLDLKEKLLESKFKEFDLISEKVNNCLKEAELKEENFTSVQRLVEECSCKLGERESQFEEKVNEFKVRVKEFELKVKANTPPCLVKTEQLEQTDTLFASLRSCMSKQKEDIVGVLNQQLKRHNLVCRETFAVFQASLDPAKLVLDAIQEIQHLHSSSENAEFGEILCILLPGLLMKASPEIISPRVKEEAMKLALEWWAKVTVARRDNHLEVFGLLQFIASYRLASAFNVHRLLDIVCLNDQASQSKKRRDATLVSQPEQRNIELTPTVGSSSIVGADLSAGKSSAMPSTARRSTYQLRSLQKRCLRE